MANTVVEIRRMVRRILKQAPGEVVFCYEAGCCGFTLQRRIESFGSRCQVIAPQAGAVGIPAELSGLAAGVQCRIQDRD